MYERYHRSISTRDDLKVYLDEIDSVKEIYTKEFSIKGRVLDIGGHQGRLRHYLNDSAVSFYISVDPFISVFEGIESHTNLLKAYPSLLKPCNFLACHAEYLPFETRSFDFVHMRSVLDHFQDPYLALREAYRVLVEGGEMLVGLSVEGRRLSMSGILHGKRLMVLRFYEKLKREGLQVTKRIPKVISGRDHMFHWKYSDLIDLLGKTKFRIIKEHWQKPPFDMCIYILAGKQSTP
jgi:SAM-dependent methyltransferase